MTGIGPFREDYGPITDSGASSGWTRIEGEGRPTDYSAGPSFDPDFRGTPRLHVVPALDEAVPDAPERPETPVTVHPAHWTSGRYMRFVTREQRDGIEGTWEELDAPKVDRDRLQYLAAKHMAANGGVGVGRLLDTLEKLGIRRKGER